MRNLAQRSAGAAKEIKALIGDSVEKIDVGSRLVDQAASLGKAVSVFKIEADHQPAKPAQMISAAPADMIEHRNTQAHT